jgi:hypothetical protein
MFCKILTRITGTLYKSKRILMTTQFERKKDREKQKGIIHFLREILS